MRHIDRFFDDCSAETLPAVSIVDPDFRSCSEENPQNTEPDNVLPRSLLERGAPVRWALQSLGLLQKLRAVDPAAGRYDRDASRVPAVVVSPFAKKGYASSANYDHTSVLKLIEHKWDLPPLTERDADVAGPLDMVDSRRWLCARFGNRANTK